MNISELGDESFVVAYVVIEGPFKPEVGHLGSACGLFSRLSGDLSFEDLHEAWEQAGSGLADQQVNVLRHDNVSENVHFKTLARLFQSSQERVFHVHLAEEWKAVVTTERQEVRLSGIMEPFEALRHLVVLGRCHDSIGLCAFPPSRQKEGAKTGHGAFVPTFAFDNRWWSLCFPAFAPEKRHENGTRCFMLARTFLETCRSKDLLADHHPFVIAALGTWDIGGSIALAA